jgi:hypothetical protein
MYVSFVCPAEYYPGDWLSRELNEPGTKEILQKASVQEL